MGRKRISITAGFITNSSSVVYHFPRHLWEHPQIQAFAEVYGITEQGYVSDQLWNRARCDSVALTQEEKEKLRKGFLDSKYGSVELDTDHDGPLIVYGDEYQGLAHSLVNLAKDLASEEDVSPPEYLHGYN